MGNPVACGLLVNVLAKSNRSYQWILTEGCISTVSPTYQVYIRDPGSYVDVFFCRRHGDFTISDNIYTMAQCFVPIAMVQQNQLKSMFEILPGEEIFKQE